MIDHAIPRATRNSVGVHRSDVERRPLVPDNQLTSRIPTSCFRPVFPARAREVGSGRARARSHPRTDSTSTNAHTRSLDTHARTHTRLHAYVGSRAERNPAISSALPGCAGGQPRGGKPFTRKPCRRSRSAVARVAGGTLLDADAGTSSLPFPASRH